MGFAAVMSARDGGRGERTARSRAKLGPETSNLPRSPQPSSAGESWSGSTREKKTSALGIWRQQYWEIRRESVSNGLGIRGHPTDRLISSGINFPASPYLGYHPWHTHLYHLEPRSSPPSKRAHYRSVLLPSPSSPSCASQSQQLEDIINSLPEPVAFELLLEQMRRNLEEAKRQGRKVIVGEVGVDRSYRIPYPDSAPPRPGGQRLTPFRSSLDHQLSILGGQFDLANAFSVPISLHSVKAQGATLDFLKTYAKEHAGWTDRCPVDVHSCGGWSVEGWADAEVRPMIGDGHWVERRIDNLLTLLPLLR